MLQLPTFFQREIILEFWLEQSAVVCIKLFDINDRFIEYIIENQILKKGKQIIKIRKK